jgi:hypothetical protein
MNVSFKRTVFAGFLYSLLGFTSSAVAQDQIVVATSSLNEVADGAEVTITVSYDVTGGALTTGLGLRMHFDSSKLSAGAIADELTVDKIGMQISDDADDYDNDASTDKYINASWASFSGAWPSNTDLPATLYTVPFTAQAGFSDTSLNFTAQSVAVGYNLNGTGVTLYQQAGPVITPAADITVTATDASGTAASNSDIAEFLAAASAVDNVDGATSVSNDAPDQFPVGSTTVTFSSADSLGNVGTATAVVTVADESAPTVVPPSSLIVDSVDAFGTPASAAPIAAFLAAASGSDNIDSSVTLGNDAPEFFPLGVTTVTFTATDAAGNTGSSSATVTVSDLSPPVVTAPANIVLAATDANGVSTDNEAFEAFISGATAVDVVAGNVGPLSSAYSTILPLGVTTIEWTATDPAGNSASASATVTVTDQDAPVLTAPADISIAADNADGVSVDNADVAAFLAGATGVDNVDSSVTVINNAGAMFAIGTSAIEFSAVDTAGNAATTVTAQITVSDLTGPVIDVPAAISVLGTNDGAPVSADEIVALIANATATDNVDGAITAITNDAPNAFPLGDTVVTFSAEDAAGNQSSAQTVVTVSLDIVAPELSVPASISLTVDMPGDVRSASDEEIASLLAGASATDNNDGDLTGSITNDAPTEFPVGDTVVTFSVSDLAGNQSTGSATVTVAVLDTDSDGLPDFYETANGLDPNDASDAALDLDGDGISNLDEYQNGTDPTKDELPPVMVIPDDLTVAANGRLTSVDLGTATATDDKDGELTPTASNTGPFVSGAYEIVWSVEDAAGNVAQASQMLTVLPTVNMTPSSLTSEGSVVEVSVVLSGDAPAYPVTIPVTVGGTAQDGSDFSLSATEITIVEGTGGSMTISILEDAEADSQETIELTLGEPVNAALGSVTARTITIIEENLAPQLALMVEQGGSQGRIVAVDGGVVTVTASYSDLNVGDSHILAWDTSAWVAEEGAAPDFVVDGDAVSFDPASSAAGTFLIAATVTDSGNPILEATKSAAIKLLATAPVLDAAADSDGDGISDAEEGLDDSDGDGIPDYQDNIAESYLAPVGGDSGQVMQAPAGTTITLGDAAFATGNNSVGLSEDQLVELTGTADDDFNYPSGLLDFAVSGAIPGESYRLVLPLSTPVPANASFRKFIDANIGWQEFVVNATNNLATASAVAGACPEPGSDLFVDGLTEGHTCIELFIEDGGPNDSDGAADGTVTDPSGMAVLYFGPPSSDSTVALGIAELKANGSDTTSVTVTAVDSDGRALEGMTVSATVSAEGSTVGSFTEQGVGVYTATLTTGKTGGTASVTATISDGIDSISVTSGPLELTKSGGGGCTVGVNTSPDYGLVLILMIVALLSVRRRLQTSAIKLDK